MKLPLVKLEQLYTWDFIQSDMGLFVYFGEELDGTEPMFPLVVDFIQPYDLTLDEDYFSGYSAEKYLSSQSLRLIKNICTSLSISFESFLDGTISVGDLGSIVNNFTATISWNIYARFGEKWKRVYETLFADYNPIENYNMLQERIPDLVDTTTGGVSSDSETNGKRWGFNSNSANNPRPTDRNTGTSTTKTNSKVTYKGKDTLTRSGNIGVTTTQQMIESELELRKHDFYEIIYKDIDSILCLEIY